MLIPKAFWLDWDRREYFTDRGRNDLVERTAHAATRDIEDVGLNHGGGDITVTQEFLDTSDVVT
jgi:hypothetical protein